MDSAKSPGVRGNWWLFGSFLECEKLFSTGFMSSEAWELRCPTGLGNAREGWTIRWVKKGNSLEEYSDQKLRENSYILCLILYMNVESQWKKTDHLRAGSRPSRVRVMFLFCFVFHQKLNTPIFSSSLAGKEIELNKDLFTHQLLLSH